MSIENASAPVQVVSPKSNGCLKFFLYFLAVLGLCSCCCCFGLFGLSGYMGYAMQNAITIDSEQIVQLTDSYFGAVTIPEGFAPKAGFDLKFPLSSKTIVAASVYTEGESMLILGSCLFELPKESLEDMRSEALKSFNQSNSEMTVLSSTIGNVEISGTEYPFMFNMVRNKKGDELLEVIGTFPTSKSQSAFALFLLDPEQYSEEAAIEILKSVK